VSSAQKQLNASGDGRRCRESKRRRAATKTRKALGNKDSESARLVLPLCQRDDGSSFWLPLPPTQLLVCPHHRYATPWHSNCHALLFHLRAQYALFAMAMGVMWSLCLLVCSLIGAARSEWRALHTGGGAENGKGVYLPHPSQFLMA
jgi:hypothetical protein